MVYMFMAIGENTDKNECNHHVRWSDAYMYMFDTELEVLQEH